MMCGSPFSLRQFEKGPWPWPIAALWSLPFFIGSLVPLCAQTIADNRSQVPPLTVNARAVVVDVVVTSGDDQPVLALQKQDFDVLEDGKPQTIDYFDEHTAAASPANAQPPPPQLPPGVYTNAPPAAESDAVNVILIDTLNTDRRDQVYVHKQILDFFHNMQPGTRAAIFILGSKLRFVQGFTTDTAVLLAALQDKKNGFAPEQDNSFRSREDDTADADEIAVLRRMQTAGEGIAAIQESQADFASFQFGERVSMTMAALNYLARYLAGVPGRKNLIWFASSFPVSIFPAGAQSRDRGDASAFANAVRQTADLLTASRIAVYPVGAQGVTAGHGMDPDIQDRPPANGLDSGSGDAVGRANNIYAMEKLASDTGGKAFYGTNDLRGALSHAIDDGSRYYTLVYTSTNKKMDGRFRHIEIRVTSGKYKLAYRRGYNADDKADAVAPVDLDPLRPLFVRGLPNATQFSYQVRVLPAKQQPGADAPRAGENAKLAGPVARYNIDFMIRWSDVSLEKVIPASDQKSGAHPDTEGEWRDKLSVKLIAYDYDGKAVNWIESSPQLALKPDMYAALQKASIMAQMVIDLPIQNVSLQTGVYDWGSGRAGTLEIPLHVVPAPGTGAQQAAPKTQ